jgi:hypothetical protein
MYAIRELLVTLIFAALAFATFFIPFLIFSCLYAAGQNWADRNGKLLSETSAAIRLRWVLIRDTAHKAGQSIREASLIARLR